jgi:hypothetical protein
MNFVCHHGHLWLTATEKRARVTAIRRDARVSVAISSLGSGIAHRQSLTCRGRAVVHEDAQTKRWFLPALAAAVRPGDPARQAEFARLLDSPLRVVIEVVPERWTPFDGAKMWRAAPRAARS